VDVEVEGGGEERRVMYSLVGGRSEGGEEYGGKGDGQEGGMRRECGVYPVI